MQPTDHTSIACGSARQRAGGAERRGAHLCVLLEREHDLGRAVPPRRDVFCHEARLRPARLCRLDGPREAKVAHLEVAVRVQEQVRRLEVAVDHVGRVQGLEGAEGLVDEVLWVVVREVLCPDDTVHVGLHELLDHWKASSAGRTIVRSDHDVR